tara:strand:- start:16 stop:1413 length:1398 start_codon:yes stop_codon:yes gene_type:complete
MASLCDKNMTQDECELNILRKAVDNADKIQNIRLIESEKVKKMIEIVEKFIMQKKLICYGGTAINNILPKKLQFYDKGASLPDYDFFSDNALEDAKELADIYSKNKYKNIEAKSGTHYGTYKIYVDFVPIADITSLPHILFSNLKKHSLIKDNIHYAPPNYLRMSMYLELSRPEGDVSRWEKIQKRLSLLNSSFPMKKKVCNQNSVKIDVKTIQLLEKIFVSNKVVFFGDYALSHYMKNNDKEYFDVISNDPKDLSDKILKKIKSNYKSTNIKIIEHEEIGEVIPEHIEIQIDNTSIAFIYKSVACHNYNVIRGIRIATIDTMMSFYLAFLYSNKKHHDNEKIMCLTTELFELYKNNKTNQKGVFKRFGIDCLGYQNTLGDIRLKKTQMYDKLTPGTKEWNEWFLNYNPNECKNNKKITKTNKKHQDKNKNKSKKRILSKSNKTNTRKKKNMDLNSFINIMKKMI